MVRFVVMAAGQATRMGQDKLALPWRDSTVLGYVIHMVLEAINKQHTLVELRVIARQPLEFYVSGKDRERFIALEGVWQQMPNPKPLAETIRLGLGDLNSTVQMIGFLPGDQVGVTAQALADCLHQAQILQPDFLVPMAGETTGSPVFFHRRYVPELLALQGEQGGREVLFRYPKRWIKHRVKESIFLDVDTPEQYQSLQSLFSGRSS